MAKKPASKVATSKASVMDVVAGIQKDLGEKTAMVGGYLIDVERIPTGIYEFDLASGGGFPRGKVSIVYGKESSNKTNLALKAIANNQRLRPAEVNVFIDVENEWNSVWATKMGVDVTKVVVIKPDFAEQVVNMVEGLLAAEDIGLIVIDSLAALLSTQEGSSDAEKANVGGTGLVIGKLYRKVTHGLLQAAKEDRDPTVIYINQIRLKVGIVFGNPETMPGGYGPLYQSALTVKSHGSNIKDSKFSESLPIAKEVTFQITKSKVPILAAMGKYTMVTVPYNGWKPGECDDWSAVRDAMEALGAFAKLKVGCSMLGVEYKTQKAAQEKYEKDLKFAAEIRASLIDAQLAAMQEQDTEEFDDSMSIADLGAED